MKKSKHTPEPLILEEGLYSEQSYTNYAMMNESAKNWQYNCTYQLKPNAFSGQIRTLQLSSMQLAFDKSSGGLMNDSYSALDTICVAVICESEDKACFHRIKLKAGDIIFFDNSRPYNYMANGYNSYVVLTIHSNILGALESKLAQVFNHKIKDTNGDFSTLVHEIWHRFTNTSEQKRTTKEYLAAETEILSALQLLLETQTPKMTKLTKGEEIALAIRDQVYAHMDGTISITSLATQYNVTKRTLQNSFQSLFGFTPTYFIRQMKLNLVYRDLKHAISEDETVSNIARKWGFMHMGHFSRHYTELFNENPSQTLKRPHLDENSIAPECVERQEEMY